jgi:hypothetical protein
MQGSGCALKWISPSSTYRHVHYALSTVRIFYILYKYGPFMGCVHTHTNARARARIHIDIYIHTYRGPYDYAYSFVVNLRLFTYILLIYFLPTVLCK